MNILDLKTSKDVGIQNINNDSKIPIGYVYNSSLKYTTKIGWKSYPYIDQVQENNIIIGMFSPEMHFKMRDPVKTSKVGENIKNIQSKYEKVAQQYPNAIDSVQRQLNIEKLQHSYAGILGKVIEPAIRPLGYDWKIGIAIITSFAAREVFVGTMATLYSVGDNADENSETLRDKMSAAKRADGSPVYTTATGYSLLIFYLLAMQCMSTLAVVKRETGSWKWPIIQLIYMTGLAYLLSFIAYQLLS